MRAVWSFWTPPFEQDAGWGWSDPLHHLLAWGLSVRLATRHFAETALVTDTAGACLLVERLGLRFTDVSTELDAIADQDPRLYALGKLVAYAGQERPFVHIDTDVFLWQALPERLLAARVLGQHLERWSLGDEWPGPRPFEDACARAGVDLPPEWRWARSHWGRRLFQVNCGIAGGTDVAFLRYYATRALGLVLDPQFASVWAAVPSPGTVIPIIEQFLLAACVEYHRSDPGSAFRGIHASYLFRSSEAAFDPVIAGNCGFTHLIAGAKRDPRIARRLARRVEREDPHLYRRCVDVTATTADGGLRRGARRAR